MLFVSVISHIVMASDVQEKANFTRLSRLLVDKGTEVLRNTFNGIHPPARLPAVLNANKKSLLRLKFKVINTSQWDLLYPPSGDPPDSTNFDVTLLTVLFRNICGFPPPSTGWNIIPVDTDRSVPANILRLKYFRNDVYAHVTSTKVDNATFESLWKKISQSLVELRIPQNDINDLKTCPLGPEEEIYVEMLKEYKSQEEEIKKYVEDLQCSMQEDHNEIKQLIGQSASRQDEIKKDVEDLQCSIQEGQNEIKQQIRQSASQQQDNFEVLHANLEKRYSKESDKDLLQMLAKHNFRSKIRTKVEFYHPGTREWLLQLVDEMVKKEQKWRMLLLTAGPGFGKSVFAAKVCEEFKKKGKLAACHFCDFSNSNLRDPMMMIQSLASQMCENIEGFQDKLLDQLRRPHTIRSLKDAFRVYLQNPLDELDFKEPSLVVIDGLDESEADEKNEIINLLADYFPDLPECMKVLVTSRPEIPVAKLNCTSIQKINIDNKDINNKHDLERYLKACLPSQLDKILQNSANSQYFNHFEYHGVFKVLVSKCEGSFLYAFYIQSGLLKRDDLDKITCDEIIKFLPEGLSSVYQKYFKRLEEELTTFMHKNVNVLEILKMLAASEGILPLDFLTRVFGLVPDCRETKNIINRANEAVSCLLYVSDDMVTVFHKSVIDWLLAEGYEDHEYAVKASDGNKLLWLICEKVFEEIKDIACSDNFKLTKNMKYALLYGPRHLVLCKMKEKFFWLVDIVIIYALLTAHNESKANYVRTIFYTWVEILEDVVDKLRPRISWHITEIDYADRLERSSRKHLPFRYLQSILAHSPEGYYCEKEKEVAHLLLLKDRQFVEPYFGQADVMPLAVWRFPLAEVGENYIRSTPKIKAVGLSYDKTIAAVAQRDGMISVVSVPRLVKLWDCSTHYEEISCCTFAPDDSFALFGKLETVLNIAERKEVPFFHGNKETFTSCAFSPSGKRLVTSDGSDTVKLWDVAKQSLLSSLCGDQDVNWCSYSNTGLFIVADWISDLYEEPKPEESANEDSESDWNGYYSFDLESIDSNEKIFRQQSGVFCVWNGITQQRSDKRNITDIKLNVEELFHHKLCRRCFKPGFKELTYSCKPDTAPGYQERLCSIGVYKGVECIVELCGQHLYIIEPSHFTTLAAWNFFVHVLDYSYEYSSFRKITAIEDDLWFYADVEKLIVFRTKAPTQELPCPTKVFSSSFSPDGSRLATCTSDGCINIWNVDTSKVEQRFKCNQYDLSFACWWSDNFLFVFYFVHRIPSLMKYPVGVNLKILVSKSQQVSLSHLLEEFVTFTSIVDFSYGLLIFKCRKTDPLKVVDISEVGRPQIITLRENNCRIMSITVSPGASFVFGADEYEYYLWKRNIRGELVVYEVYFFHEPSEPKMDYYIFDFEYTGNDYTPDEILFFQKHSFHCGFSNDSKVAVVVTDDNQDCRCKRVKIVDLVSDCHKSVDVETSTFYNIFCLNKIRVFINASYHFLQFFDMDSGALIESSLQRNLTGDLLEQVKLSPKETVLAFPQIRNDVTFRRLCIPQSSVLSKIKHEAAIKHEKSVKTSYELQELF